MSGRWHIFFWVIGGLLLTTAISCVSAVLLLGPQVRTDDRFSRYYDTVKLGPDQLPDGVVIQIPDSYGEQKRYILEEGEVVQANTAQPVFGYIPRPNSRILQFALVVPNGTITQSRFKAPVVDQFTTLQAHSHRGDHLLLLVLLSIYGAFFSITTGFGFRSFYEKRGCYVVRPPNGHPAH